MRCAKFVVLPISSAASLRVHKLEVNNILSTGRPLPTMSEETKTTTTDTAVASSEVKTNETAPPEPEKEPTDKKKVRENHPRVSPHAGQPGRTARILFSCPKHHFPVRTCHGTCHVPQCLCSSYPGRRGGASRRQAGEFRDWHCRPGGFLVHPRDFHLASLTLLHCVSEG